MYTKQQYAKKQPKDGDVCVHCGHFKQDKNLHFWIANGMFVRPDGSRGEYQWLVSCNKCFHQAKGNGELIQVRGDLKWKGQEPSVLKAANPYEKLTSWLPIDTMLANADNAQVVEHQNKQVPAIEANYGYPGMGEDLIAAAKELGTTELVVLFLVGRQGPAAAIAHELRKGSIPARFVKSNGNESVFVISTESAMNLIKTHGDEGGRFVAEHLEARAGLHQYWTMIIDAKEVEAVAHQGDRLTYLVASDFRGLEPEAGVVQANDF